MSTVDQPRFQSFTTFTEAAPSEPPLLPASEAMEQTRAALAFRKMIFEAAISVLGKYPDSEAKNGLIKELRAEAYPEPAEKLSPKILLGKKGELSKSLAKRLSVVIGQEPSKVEARIRARLVKKLNNAEWSPIRYAFRADLGNGDRLNVETVSVPLNEAYADLLPGAELFRSFKKKGRTSASLKGRVDPDTSALIPNGWYTKLETKDGALLLDGFRTGSLVNYGETDDSKLASNLKDNTKTLILAVSLRALSRLPEEDKAQILKGEKPLTVKIACFDLQSRESDEAELLKEDLEGFTIDKQRKALQDSATSTSLGLMVPGPSGSPVEIQIRTEISILSFNYPVVRKSFMDGTGWGIESEKRNKEALDLLLGSARKKLSSLSTMDCPADKALMRKVSFLLGEVEDMAAHRSYTSSDIDPYRMNSRLLNLAWLCGYEVQFNCRSGKDRTGFLDGEAKLLTLQLELMDGGGREPLHNSPLNKFESGALYELLVPGGSYRIQALNTGIPGSKVPPATFGPLKDDPLVKRIGGEEKWHPFKGLSQYADT